jgi:hypothetical protein
MQRPPRDLLGCDGPGRGRDGRAAQVGPLSCTTFTVTFGCVSTPAQGWYQDPYAIHEDRYFSAGLATKLVRDQGRESYDPPPDIALPDSPLIPATVRAHADAHPEAAQPTDSERMRRAVFDYFDRLPKQ